MVWLNISATNSYKILKWNLFFVYYITCKQTTELSTTGDCHFNWVKLKITFSMLFSLLETPASNRYSKFAKFEFPNLLTLLCLVSCDYKRPWHIRLCFLCHVFFDELTHSWNIRGRLYEDHVYIRINSNLGIKFDKKHFVPIDISALVIQCFIPVKTVLHEDIWSNYFTLIIAAIATKHSRNKGLC